MSFVIKICDEHKRARLDYEAIHREHFPMRTFEDISARMPKVQFFSKFDATSGYWQLPLDENSSHLTTFNTPFGRYRYLVLPFGISSASEIWQRAMEEEFADLKGVEIVVDDILVWGETAAQHDARVRELLARVKASGLKQNAKKSVIRAHAVEYVGHVISKDTVRYIRGRGFSPCTIVTYHCFFFVCARFSAILFVRGFPPFCFTLSKSQVKLQKSRTRLPRLHGLPPLLLRVLLALELLPVRLVRL